MRSRLDYCQEALGRAIEEQLEEQDEFNLIAFSSGVTPWKKKLVEASDSNKKAARKWLKALRHDGETNIHDTLELAFTLKGVDTIYFLTDGTPTVGKVTVNDTILTQLQACAPRDVQELLPHLQTRGEEHARDAEKKLHARADAEAKAMRHILETQKTHIAATAAKYENLDPKQLRLKFGDNDEELRQLDSNRRYWTKRLAVIDKDLESEPARIREVYQVKATRIEPVGLVYLWPVTG